jgi:beta-glucosidase
MPFQENTILKSSTTYSIPILLSMFLSVSVMAGELSDSKSKTSVVYNHAPKYNEFFTREMEVVVERTLKKMTLSEKLKMVNGDIEGRGPKGRGSASVDRVGIGTMVFYNGPRVFQMGRKVTLFPSGVGQAASFRPDLVRGIGAAIASEFLEAKWQVLEAPSINIIRDPLNGRNFEYFTEDPFLNARLAEAFVIGGQRAGAVTTAKHFIANNKETNRNQVNAVVGERALREIYLPAFKAVCDVGVLSLMTGANRCNGPHASDNPHLVTILKKEWGWPGFLYTDWNGVQTTVEAFNAGLDLSMPGSPTGPFSLKRLEKAHEKGLIDENTANDKVRRILRAAYFSGKLKGAPSKPRVKANRKANQKLAYKTALAGMTLVKNEKAALPITDKDQRIAVIGPMASKKLSAQSGGSSGTGRWNVAYDIPAIDGLRKRFGKKRLDYVPFSMDDVYQPVAAPYVYHLDKHGKRVQGFSAMYKGKDPTSHKPAVATETVKSIEVNWEMASPNRQVLDSSRFRAEWSALLKPPVSGNYTLRLSGSQIVHLKLDGKARLPLCVQDAKSAPSQPLSWPRTKWLHSPSKVEPKPHPSLPRATTTGHYRSCGLTAVGKTSSPTAAMAIRSTPTTTANTGSPFWSSNGRATRGRWSSLAPAAARASAKPRIALATWS